jgi:RNA polymerase sigma factor (sigma-70 family)
MTFNQFYARASPPVTGNQSRGGFVVACRPDARVTGDEERRATALMRGAQAGDKAAYAELLILLTAVASRFARSRLRSAPFVDDVVQETLLTVHRARRSYDPARPFAPWFYAILSNRLIDVIRRERRIGGREIGFDEIPEPPAAKDEDRHTIDVERIRDALRSLSAGQRDVVEGLKYRDESVRETASRLGMSESAVKVSAHRAYKRLRKLLGDDHAD